MKKFIVRAVMETDLVIEVDAKSEEEVQEMIDDGRIDGGDMVEDGMGSWTWGEISELKGVDADVHNHPLGTGFAQKDKKGE